MVILVLSCPCLFSSSSWYGWLQHTDWMSIAIQVANAMILGKKVTLDVKMNRRSQDRFLIPKSHDVDP